MPIYLHTQSPDFEAAFSAFLANKREVAQEVEVVVQQILADVRHRGDAALLEYSRTLDHLDFTQLSLRISQAEIEAAQAQCDPESLEALAFAHARILAFHQHQKPKDFWMKDALGVELGWRWTPMDAVGLYVPGGTASYPSSVLMNAIPAKVAGVARLVMAVPSPYGVLNPLVLAAAQMAGVDEIYRMGGAQAIAALAFGTKQIAPVVKIVGPGNAFVAAAKRQVFGHVGIDMIAGPSEVVIVADHSARPDWVAMDLLAQAEHDSHAQSILITDSPRLAQEVEAALHTHLTSLPRQAQARASWEDFGAIVHVETLEKALPLMDRLAPEHLEIMTQDPESIAKSVKHAGAIFLGHHTPEAIGDYVGGSNHVLPTARSARFSSGLGVLDFMKKTSLLSCSAQSLEALGPAAITLAQAEGLEAHARSIGMRLQRNI